MSQRNSTLSRRSVACSLGALALLCSPLGGIGATRAATPAPSTAPPKPVAFLVDEKVRATGLSAAAALARAASMAHFTPQPLKTLPPGMMLLHIDVAPYGGAYSPVVTFRYATSLTRYGLRFHEQVVGKLFDKTGRPMKVGKKTVYMQTSYAYVYLTWTDGKLLYSLDNVTTRLPDVDLKTLLAVVKSV